VSPRGHQATPAALRLTLRGRGAGRTVTAHTDVDGWRIDQQGRRMGTYETWEPSRLCDIVLPITHIAFLVRGPGESDTGAIAEVWSHEHCYGWTSLWRLRSLMGDKQTDEWLEEKRVLWVNHEAALSSPSFKRLLVPGGQKGGATVPWKPTWCLETIKDLRRRDFDLHADDDYHFASHSTWAC
jgi:hypothetical protein